ncbi:hypothetical protein M758_8G128600 [Ceratodon purpureus]|uniref:F-box domain-containing protein n=1 Tax=Ceratodon purpureus TaxID=3225 RepID=A0A8T0GY47_CERPU|nr:hypothetical protein KC19_8G133000 [Ceratodon purpureus]KAG0608741.1 hypothetical protein M758_8G128600 [Ceratodon purpureus]
MGGRGGGEGKRVAQEESCALLQFPDEILEKVIDFLPDPTDRNALSLVCKRLNAIDWQSRETVMISNCYAIRPMTLVSRFPHAKSITIKGKPRIVDFSLIPHAEVWGAYAAPWVDVLVRFYRSIRHLKMKRMHITDSDIERLVSVCGRSLQKLELEKCSGFSTWGLEVIARACRNLVVLNLSEADIMNEGAPYWMTTLANTARSLQVLDLSLTDVEDVEQHVLVNLASRCLDLRLCVALKVDHVLPVVNAANKNCRHLGIGLYSQNVENPDQIAEAFGRCKGLQGISALWDLDEGSMMMVMPIAARLTSLDLTYALLGQPELTDLLGTCVNLEDLQCTDIIGDRGLREVGAHCTKLRRLVVQQDEAGFVTQHGLTAVAEGCFLLEKVIIYAADMTNKALETLANNCPGLSDIRICLVQKYHDSHPVIELEGSSTLNLGVKALLMKCPKARRLALCFSRFGLSNVVITDEGMSYIGKYGGSLDIITLTNCGGSDAGLAFVAVGCVKLRKLELRHCPFGDASMAALALGCPSLKQLWVQACQVELAGVRMLAQRPGLIVEVVKESSSENGVMTPWQLIAYSSAAPPRTDLPDNIDLVHDTYCTPLYSEHYLCPSTVEEGLEVLAEGLMVE